jgi:hypothetical protein
MDFINFDVSQLSNISKLDLTKFKMNSKDILGSWKYALLAGFLALLLCSVPFDDLVSKVLPKYQSSWAPPLYKMMFVTILFYLVGSSQWFQSL